MKNQLPNLIFRILTNGALVLVIIGIFYRAKFDWAFFTNKKNNNDNRKTVKKSALFIVSGMILLTISFIYHSIFIK